MPIKIRKVIIYLSIIVFNSCGKSEQEITDENERIAKKRESLRENKTKLLTQKYNAVDNWGDGIEEPFIYVLQEMFIDQKRNICFDGAILDIIKSDSTYYLKIIHNNYFTNTKYIAVISIPKIRIAELKKLKKSNSWSNEGKGIFIFSVSSIISKSPEIRIQDKIHKEDTYSNLEYDFDSRFIIFKGNLLDFYMNE